MNSAILSIVILVVCIFGYIFEVMPPAMIALSSCCFMVIFGGVPAEKAFGAFADDNVLLMVGFLVIGLSLTKSGAMSVFGRKVKRLFRDNTELVILSLYVSVFLMSAFINNSSAVLCFLPLFLEIIINGNNHEKYYEQKYVQAISIVAHAGGLVTLMGSSVNLTGSGLLESFGYEGFSYLTLAPYGLVLFISGILHIYLYGNRVTKKMRDENPRTELVKEFEESYQKDKDENLKFNKQMILSLGILFLTAIALSTTKFHSVTRGTIGVTAAMLCCITGCIEFSEMTKKMKWQAVLTFAGMLGFSKCLTTAGGAQLIAETSLKLFGNMATPVSVLIAFTLISFAMTQFVSNVSTASILIPIAIPMVEVIGGSALGVCVAITVAASCAFMTPMASYVQAMIMDWGSYKFKDYLVYSWPLAIIDLILIIGITLVLF